MRRTFRRSASPASGGRTFRDPSAAPSLRTGDGIDSRLEGDPARPDRPFASPGVPVPSARRFATEVEWAKNRRFCWGGISAASTGTSHPFRDLMLGST